MTQDSSHETTSDDANDESLPEDLGAGADQPMGAPPIQSYETALPDIDHDELDGHLVVLEGPDGSGRTTQIDLLTEWLEWNGHAVQTMGLRRSRLMAENIDELLGRNEVRRLTLALLYATDFYDQLSNSIIPALKAGFVVLADRYVYTLIARAAVRGIDREYLREVYSFSPQPDLAVRLEVSPRVSFERIFEEKQAISYWEAGGDLNLADTLFDSFVEYQELLREEFERLDDQSAFDSIDGEASVREINDELRERLAEHLGIESTDYTPSEELLPLWNK
jgi:dTMP kinase